MNDKTVRVRVNQEYQITTEHISTEERMGVVEDPLFNHVEISNYIFPVLHVSIGLGNYAIAKYFYFVDATIVA